MIMQVFTIRDKASEAFLPPIFFRHVGEAIRAFESAVRQEGHNFNTHKSDFSLYACGTWDDNSGLFSPRDPELLMNALQVSSE